MATYVRPDDVISPKDSWKKSCVFYDEGEGKIAIAYGEWNSEMVIAIRWNGYNKAHKTLGNPQSSGNATWFILPQDIGILIVKDILLKRVTDNKCVRVDCIQKVIEWVTSLEKINSDSYCD